MFLVKLVKLEWQRLLSYQIQSQLIQLCHDLKRKNFEQHKEINYKTRQLHTNTVEPEKSRVIGADTISDYKKLAFSKNVENFLQL